MSFNHMKTMLSHSGDTIRQSKINDGKILMSEQLKADPSFNPDMVFWQFGVNADDFESAPIKTFNEKYSAANGVIIQFNTLIDNSIVVGDVLYDKKRDIYWICTESFNRDEILCVGKLTRCNYWMRWQDDKKNTFEYPVFEINSTQYNSGESGDKTLTLGSSQHLVTVMADKNTIALDHGKRFFWDRDTVNPTVFKITQNDTTAMNYDKGLLKITIMEDQYDSDKDSIENWLCDYFKVSEVTILYSGNSPTIRVGGTKTLTVDTTDTVKWSIISDIGATIVSDGNTAKVKCPYGTDFVGKEITVTATVGGNSGQCVLTITGGV